MAADRLAVFARLRALVAVGAHLLHIGRQRRGNLGRDALRLFVVLDVFQARDDAGKLRHAAHLANAVKQGNVVHTVGGHTLQVARAISHTHALGWVALVHIKGAGPAPCVTLHALFDAATRGKHVLVVIRHQVGLEHLQTQRHAAAVRQSGHAAHQLLREGLAIADPGQRHEALDLRHAVAARYFGFQAKLAPRRAQLGGIFFVNGAIGSAWLRLNANALRPHHVVDHGAQNATADVVVAVQLPGLRPDGDGAQLRELVGALRVVVKLAVAAG